MTTVLGTPAFILSALLDLVLALFCWIGVAFCVIALWNLAKHWAIWRRKRRGKKT